MPALTFTFSLPSSCRPPPHLSHPSSIPNLRLPPSSPPGTLTPSSPPLSLFPSLTPTAMASASGFTRPTTSPLTHTSTSLFFPSSLCYQISTSFAFTPLPQILLSSALSSDSKSYCSLCAIDIKSRIDNPVLVSIPDLSQPFLYHTPLNNPNPRPYCSKKILMMQPLRLIVKPSLIPVRQSVIVKPSQVPSQVLS